MDQIKISLARSYQSVFSLDGASILLMKSSRWLPLSDGYYFLDYQKKKGKKHNSKIIRRPMFSSSSDWPSDFRVEIITREFSIIYIIKISTISSLMFDHNTHGSFICKLYISGLPINSVNFLKKQINPSKRNGKRIWNPFWRRPRGQQRRHKDFRLNIKDAKDFQTSKVEMDNDMLVSHSNTRIVGLELETETCVLRMNI